MGKEGEGEARTGMTSRPMPSPGRRPIRRARVAIELDEGVLDDRDYFHVMQIVGSLQHTSVVLTADRGQEEICLSKSDPRILRILGKIRRDSSRPADANGTRSRDNHFFRIVFRYISGPDDQRDRLCAPSETLEHNSRYQCTARYAQPPP